MIKVGVVGAGGRMGQEVCRAVGAADGLLLVAVVDPGHSGESLAALIGEDVDGLVVAGALDALVEAQAEVAVDFTVLEAAKSNLEWYAAHGIHAVVGTSGFTEEDLGRAA